MKILKIVFALIAAIAVIVVATALTKPASFHVERSITIKAPPAKVYAALEDFRRWPEWSPWEKLDPAMRRSLSGAPKGPGAAYAWEGNDKVGAGRMEITHATAPKQLAIQLDFFKPFEAHNVATFTLEPYSNGDATSVRWAMDGPASFPSKLMQVFVSMDALVGQDFENGLANLKALSER